MEGRILKINMFLASYGTEREREQKSRWREKRM